MAGACSLQIRQYIGQILYRLLLQAKGNTLGKQLGSQRCRRLREFITLFVHSFSHAGRRRKDTAMSGMGRGWEIAPLLRLVHRVARYWSGGDSSPSGKYVLAQRSNTAIASTTIGPPDSGTKSSTDWP